MREIGDIVREYERRRGEPLALATLVRVIGSGYRRPGARMLIAREGPVAGSLSGGCLEEEVADKAREVLRTGQAEMMTFDTRRRFGCNGILEIAIEKTRDEFLQELAASHHRREPCLVATGIPEGSRLIGELPLPNDSLFIQRIDPPIRLLVFGVGPDNEVLCGMASLLGWQVSIHHDASELDDPCDGWTAAIVKTHNYGRDFAILRTLLGRGLHYIGLMGPRARREQLLGDLLDTGIKPGTNLFAPAGIDLAADAPETISLSIIAEIQAVFGGGSRKSLRERKSSIHIPECEARPVPV